MPQTPDTMQGLGELKGVLHAEWEMKWKDRYEQMGQLKRADFFLELGRFTNDVFRESEMFRGGRTILGQDRQADVVAAVTGDNYSNIDPMKSTKDYKSVLEVARSKEELKREIILDFLDHETELGLSREEQVIVRGFLKMAPILDTISEKWRDEIVWSETGRKIAGLSDTEKVKLPVTLANLGLDHTYAVLRAGDTADFNKLTAGEQGHGYYEVSQMEVFREDYSHLSEAMAGIIQNLKSFDSPSQIRDQYLAYFGVWKDLCDAKDIPTAQRLGEELDRAWMNLPDDLLVTHPMEYGYYSPDGIRKDVMARIDITDPTKAELIKMCNEQRQAVYEYLSTHPKADETPILKANLSSLLQTRFLALAPITFSMSYDFKTAGESIPNSDHQRVTDELGKRILVFLDGCENSWGRRMAAWKQVYGESDHEGDIDSLRVSDWIIISLATHESGETVSRDAKTDERLGFFVAADINENKADTAGLAYMGELAKAGKLSQEQMKKVAKVEIATILFDLSRWGMPTTEPYYKTGLITANLALETGLLKQGENHTWIPDYTKSKEFLTALTDFFWNHQAPVWESENATVAQSRKAQLIDPYLKTSGGVHDILCFVSERYRQSHVTSASAAN